MIENYHATSTLAPPGLAALRPSGDTMTAGVLVAPRQFELQTVPLPVMGPDQVLVKVEGGGVCGSNLPVWEGREWFQYPLPPGQPGHEAWGVIVDAGRNVLGLRIGERVAMLSYHGFAEYEAVNANMAVRLPAALGDQPFPGEPLACAINVFARSGIRAGDQVAIVGIGFLGALLTALAARSGAEVIAISRRAFALDLATHFGAAHTILMDDHWRIIDAVKKLTQGEGCACVIEAVGQQWPLDLAAELTRVRGRLVVAGYHQDGPRQVNMQLWNWRGLDVINAHERDEAIYLSAMRAAVDAVTSGWIDPSPLYTHTVPFENLPEAFALLAERPDGFCKALVRM